MSARFIGISAALGSAASWAVGAILFRKLGDSLSPLAMTLVKGAVSVVLLGMAMIWSDFEGLDARSVVLLALSGGVGIAMGDTFFFQALRDLGPFLLVVVGLLGQVLTVAFAVLFLGEHLSWSIALGIALVVSGIGTVLFSKLSGERTPSHWRGITFGLLSAVCMAVSVIVAKLGLKADPDTLPATFIRMLAGTVALLVVGLASRQMGRWVMPFQDWALARRFVLATGVVTFGGFWLSLVAVKYVEVSIANTLISVEPLLVLPLAAVFCKEKVTCLAVAGAVMSVAGIVLLCWG